MSEMSDAKPNRLFNVKTEKYLQAFLSVLIIIIIINVSYKHSHGAHYATVSYK